MPKPVRGGIVYKFESLSAHIVMLELSIMEEAGVCMGCLRSNLFIHGQCDMLSTQLNLA